MKKKKNDANSRPTFTCIAHRLTYLTPLAVARSEKKSSYDLMTISPNHIFLLFLLAKLPYSSEETPTDGPLVTNGITPTRERKELLD